jgi:multidrug efflux system membrane fusion protein
MNSPGKLFGSLAILAALQLLPIQTLAAEVDATLHWVRTVPLSTTVSGVIEQVNVSKGDRVHEGQVLLNLVGKTFAADVEAKKAGLKRAENNDEESERELERNQELYDRTLLSEHDLQLAQIQRDAGAADLQEARAALAKAERDYYYSVVRAPFDAWILQRNAEPGQTVIVKFQASPLLVLAEAGRMLARAKVSGETAGKLKQGQRATVSVSGKNYLGKIHFVAMEPVKSGVDEYIAEVVFESGKLPMRVGQSVRVKF